MEENLSFQRTYTALLGLQKARSIRYSLRSDCVGGEPCFGVCVCQKEHEGNREEECLFTHCRSHAELMLTYLYENAVPPEHCVSVISDAYAALQWEEHDGVRPNPTTHCG